MAEVWRALQARSLWHMLVRRMLVASRTPRPSAWNSFFELFLDSDFRVRALEDVEQCILDFRRDSPRVPQRLRY